MQIILFQGYPMADDENAAKKIIGLPVSMAELQIPSTSQVTPSTPQPVLHQNVRAAQVST